MLSDANHVISAASIAIFAIRVTPGQRIDWLASFSLDGQPVATVRLFRLESTMHGWR
jgi:hypothetical protein